MVGHDLISHTSRTLAKTKNAPASLQHSLVGVKVFILIGVGREICIASRWDQALGGK